MPPHVDQTDDATDRSIHASAQLNITCITCLLRFLFQLALEVLVGVVALRLGGVAPLLLRCTLGSAGPRTPVGQGPLPAKFHSIPFHSPSTFRSMFLVLQSFSPSVTPLCVPVCAYSACLLDFPSVANERYLVVVRSFIHWMDPHQPPP